METWCFDSLDIGYVSNETLGWDFKVPSNYENIMFAQSQQLVENPGFPAMGLSEMMSKQFPYNSAKNGLYNEGFVGNIVSPSTVISNLVSGEEESSSMLSSSVVDSSSRESSLIDLKLGGFSDELNCISARVAPCSSESSTRVKRVRRTRFSSQTIYCQVYGCNKDLSSAKDYHKRHKVCDAHSKTSKVIVNGAEKRFCQQCSRFHLLGEFDDGKRSCRKRLAGHNERRRKPQVGYNKGGAGRSFSFTGTFGGKFQGTTLTAASFTCQDTHPRGASHAETFEPNGWGAYVKIKDEIDYSQKSSNVFKNGQLQENTNLSPFLLGRQYCSIDSISKNNSLGSKDLTPFDIASTVQGLPVISESACALSLLSSHSQNFPDDPSEIPGAHSLGISNKTPYYNVNEVSEKLLGVGSWDPTSGNQNRYSFGRKNESTMSALRNGESTNSSFGNGILEGSDFMVVDNRLSSQEGGTGNLLQLSSQLQRVENQRQTATGKQEIEFRVP